MAILLLPKNKNVGVETKVLINHKFVSSIDLPFSMISHLITPPRQKESSLKNIPPHFNSALGNESFLDLLKEAVALAAAEAVAVAATVLGRLWSKSVRSRTTR